VSLSFTGSPQNAGSYPVTATINDANYTGSASATLTINKANATVTFDAASLSQTYSGAVKTVSTTTTPAGLSVDLSFTGTPQNAGSFAVTATINDTNYTGSASATLTINKADASVTFDAASLSQTYSGTVKTVSTTTTPAGLSVSLSFTGAPQNAGSYPVTATISDANYTGSASATLTVTPATLSVVANHQTKVAGAVDPPLTFVATGFQSGDTAAVLTGALTRAPGETAGTYAIGQGTLAAGPNYTIAFTGSTLDITAPPPPPPTEFTIAPIAPQSNAEGDRVELQVMVIGAGLSAGIRNEEEPGGLFSAAGLPGGLRISKEDGEISGRIKSNAAGTYHVTVSFTQNGVTVHQRFMWKITKAAPRQGGKG